MSEEIKTDNSCIIKAFENNPITILHEKIGNKKIYCFKASDIGKALNLANIRTSIVNFDEDELVVRTTYDTIKRKQETIFLTSRGVYRLLYNSKKPEAKKFRNWAGDILDDIIFNESKELRKQLEEKEKQHQIELKEKDTTIKEQQVKISRIEKRKLEKYEKKEHLYIGSQASLRSGSLCSLLSTIYHLILSYNILLS